MSDFATWVEKNRGLWTRVYDEVIAPDFEREWKNREDEHKAELKEKDENQQLLFNHINEQIVKNARVVEENERLETELQQRAESTAPLTSLEEAAATSSGVPEEEHHSLTKRYDELSKKYHDLSQKAKYLERKNITVMQKNRDMKDSVRAWQKYADLQKPKHKSKSTKIPDAGPSRLSAVVQDSEAPPHMPSSPGSTGTARTPLLHAEQGRLSPAPGVPPTEVESGLQEALYEPGDHLSSASVTPKGPSAMSRNSPSATSVPDPLPTARWYRDSRFPEEITGVPGSSQTTVDEGAEQTNRQFQAAATEDEDDVPQVVSERSLKRKRGQQSKVDMFAGRSSDGTPAKPHRVKDEPLSSPPPAMHVLMRTETIDLDDPTSNGFEGVPFLRKASSSYLHPNSSSRHQRSNSAPFSQYHVRENAQMDSRTQEQISNVAARLQVAAAEMRALSEPTDPHSDDHILQPIDLNIVAQTPGRSPNKRSKQAEARRKGHGILAESGEASPPVDENELRLPPGAARARLNQRMRATKNPQTPANRLQRTRPSGSPLVKQEQPPTPSSIIPRPTQTSPELRTSVNQQDNIIPDGRPVWSMRAPDKQVSAQKSSISPLNKQSCLRTKPVKELRVQDFKPNPAYNQGYTYAFSEAVRKRSDRLCLPGCTNPQCCGSTFRRLAEALEPLSAPQEEALLEEYLGDAYSSVVCTQMSSDERAELVLQARTKKMAKDAGKHREAYEGRRTPPGFWRVDFPTTQEQEEDRQRAKEHAVKTVQERWLEAQKKGGKWIFRDE